MNVRHMEQERKDKERLFITYNVRLRKQNES